MYTCWGVSNTGLLSCIQAFPKVGMSLFLESNKLSSNSNSAASLCRPLRFGESIGFPKPQLSLVQYPSEVALSLLHWLRYLTACWEFRRLLASCLLPALLSNKVIPEQCPPLTCCRDFSDLHYGETSVLPIWSSKSQPYLPCQDTDHVFTDST